MLRTAAITVLVALMVLVTASVVVADPPVPPQNGVSCPTGRCGAGAFDLRAQRSRGIRDVTNDENPACSQQHVAHDVVQDRGKVNEQDTDRLQTTHMLSRDNRAHNDPADPIWI